MSNLVRNKPEPKAAQAKGGTYIRLHGDLQAQFKDLMRSLDFNPESPRADAGVKQVGEMVAAMGIELARACLATGTENLTEYVAKVTEATGEAGVEAIEAAEPAEQPTKAKK